MFKSGRLGLNLWRVSSCGTSQTARSIESSIWWMAGSVSRRMLCSWRTRRVTRPTLVVGPERNVSKGAMEEVCEAIDDDEPWVQKVAGPAVDASWSQPVAVSETFESVLEEGVEESENHTECADSVTSDTSNDLHGKPYMMETRIVRWSLGKVGDISTTPGEECILQGTTQRLRLNQTLQYQPPSRKRRSYHREIRGCNLCRKRWTLWSQDTPMTLCIDLSE